jgi:UDP-N-acetylmuramoylalanine--D-glutamate ligase
MSLENTTVLVLGAGHSGLAMARWCARQGARVRVWDSREQPPQWDAIVRSIPDTQRVLTSDPASPPGVMDVGAALDGVSLVLKSPGLAPRDDRIAPLLSAARKRKIAVQGELECFARSLVALKEAHGYAPKLLAITGTNGKTTTTTLTALLVERCGKRVAMAGNVGPTMLDTLAERCVQGANPGSNVDEWPQVWVLELSSFQLDGVEGFDPDAAAVLNVTQDHLDWHGDMASYAAAKARIFGAHTTLVLNRDDPMVEAMAPTSSPTAAAPDASVSSLVAALRVKPARKRDRRDVVRFGLNAPAQPGDFGLVVEGGMAWLVRALDDTAGGHRHDSDVLLQRLMPVDALRIRGRHNAANALAALALATAIGCPLAPMLHGLREYEGEPHRVEMIASVGGVEAFDDSKGTNVGATVAAIQGLGADRDPSRLILVLGGDGKGQDFTPLAQPLARYARAVALIGRDASRIEDVLPHGLPRATHASLEDATRWCFDQASAGDAVLLSPACASMDMFRNYEHRAQVFVATVRELAAERGEVMA